MMLQHGSTFCTGCQLDEPWCFPGDHQQNTLLYQLTYWCIWIVSVPVSQFYLIFLSRPQCVERNLQVMHLRSYHWKPKVFMVPTLSSLAAQHPRLPYLQPLVLQMKTKLASWRVSVFNCLWNLRLMYSFSTQSLLPLGLFPAFTGTTSTPLHLRLKMKIFNLLEFNPS